MKNCIVTKLQAIFDNNNLPELDTITEFALGKIAYAGNKTMTDEQKFYVSKFFNMLQAPANGTLWQKVDFILMPIISGTLTGALSDIKSETRQGASNGDFTLGADGYLYTSGVAVTVRTNYSINPMDFGFMLSCNDGIDGLQTIITQSSSPVVDLTLTSTRMSLRVAKNAAIYNDYTISDYGSELMFNSTVISEENTQSLYIRDSDNQDLITSTSPAMLLERVTSAVGLSANAKLGVLNNSNAGIAVCIVGKSFTQSESETILEAVTMLKKAFVPSN